MGRLNTIVAGSRGFCNLSLVTTVLDTLFSERTNVAVISGHAKGADTLGETYAKSRHLPMELYPADWDKYGKSAGYRRNAKMASVSDTLVAFWDMKSRGTQHMIDLAKEYGLEVLVINTKTQKLEEYVPSILNNL